MSDHKPMINVTRGTVMCERAVLADRPFQRMRGLLGRQSLQPGDGLLLHPAPSIHTAFMRFPIDVVFLDRESVVLRVVHTLAPWRAASASGARSVLELTAGEAARRGVTVGDWLIRVSEDLIWADSDGGRRVLDAIAGDVEPPAATSDRQLGATQDAEAGAPEGRREVLLVSRDRRFRAVMAVLLSARGMSVTPSTSYPDMATSARTPAEVVVIDVGDSLSNAEQAAASAGLMTSDRTVVFVSDNDSGAMTAARVIPKWESLEHLCDEIALVRNEPVGKAKAPVTPLPIAERRYS
jgi:hypothetical protein